MTFSTLTSIVQRGLLFGLLLLLGAVPLFAQPVDSLIVQGKNLLADGFNETNLDKMRQARAIFERATNDAKRAALAHYYMGLAHNRIANLMATTDEKQALTHVDQAIEHLQQATKLDGSFAEAHALLSSVYGRKIGMKPMLGMIMGPKADVAIKKAKQLDPDNPRIIYIEAMSDFHKPETWGGSIERAIDGLQRAAGLFAEETVTDPLMPDWGHDETYAWLGIAYIRKEQPDDARQAFEKALAINPDFGWVKDYLLPQLDKATDS